MKTLYNPDIHPELAAQYALDGLIDVEIAEKLGIGVRTFYDWQKKHPQFSQSIKVNKQVVDYKVEQCLLKKCLGCILVETKTTVFKKKVIIKTKDGQTSTITEEPSKIETITKEILPDTLACLAWLRNRQRNKWKFNPDSQPEHNEGTLNDLIESLKNIKPTDEQIAN